MFGAGSDILFGGRVHDIAGGYVAAGEIIGIDSNHLDQNEQAMLAEAPDVNPSTIFKLRAGADSTVLRFGIQMDKKWLPALVGNHERIGRELCDEIQVGWLERAVQPGRIDAKARANTMTAAGHRSRLS